MVVLENWILEAISKDDWEVISETEPYSSSVVDTFSMFFEVIDYLHNFFFLEIRTDGSRNQIFIVPLATTIHSSLSFYFNELFKKGFVKIDQMQHRGLGGWHKKKFGQQELKLMADKLHKLKTGFLNKKRDALRGLKSRIPGKEASLRKREKLASKQSKVTPKTVEEQEEREFNDDVYLLCVITNDLETCRMLLSDIISHLETAGGEDMAEVFSFHVQGIFGLIKEKIDQLLRLILDSIHSTMLGFLVDLISAHFHPDSVELLFNFLNFQLAPFADTFYPQVRHFYRLFFLAHGRHLTIPPPPPSPPR